MIKKQIGLKFDREKPQVVKGFLSYFPRAIISVTRVSEFGAKKYAWNNWPHVKDGIRRYENALGRHILGENIDGAYDLETKLPHAAHAAWCAMAKLELILREQENDKTN